MSNLDAAKIRSKLKHPIVDGDGHWVETISVHLDYLREVAGPDMAERYRKYCSSHDRWYKASDEQRATQRMRRATWWLSPTDTYDRATIMMPNLLRSRLDELGIDFAVMYTSIGLNFHRIQAEDMRKAVIRAYNIMTRDWFAGHMDRFAPVAVVSSLTPQEAIDEATFVKKELGLKAVMMAGAFPRVIPAHAGKVNAASDYRAKGNELPYYIEALGLDNQYDYDPLWKAFTELGVAVTSHAGSRDWVDRMSWTSDVFNHIEHFANANHTFAKAVFLGGVVKRFPRLNFAFLEGGMGWGASLCCDLQGHWEKRNWKAMQANLDPANIDEGRLRQLMEQHGGPRMKEHIDDILGSFEWSKVGATAKDLSAREQEHYDDFSRLGPIGSKRDIREMYAKNFYFGCEADDPTTVFAFDKRMKVRLKAMFSSDIGHWDVHHIEDVLPEVYEALEDGNLTDEDFREFTFSNILQLHGGMDPDFFKGTVVEQAAKDELARLAKRPDGAARAA
jgi:predicted TIM-barrel fold metal-dependent hydrolase